jgi:hypothetical protein
MPRAPNLKPPTRRRTILLCAGIGLVVALVLSLLRQTSAIEAIEWRMIDSRTRYFLGRTGPDPRIVLATIAEADVERLKEYEVWPWSLSMNAYAFKWLAACEVAAVVVDVYQFDRGAGLGEWGPLDEDGGTRLLEANGAEADVPRRTVRHASRCACRPFATGSRPARCWRHRPRTCARSRTTRSCGS